MAVYACTDLHAQRELLDRIRSFIGPHDTVYFLGDAADRGIHGWEMIKTILDDPRFIYLLGNHEDMLVNAAKDYFCTNGGFTRNFSLLRRNGGEPTFDSFRHDPDARATINRLAALPRYAIYRNAAGKSVFLCHAGITPWADPTDNSLWVPADEDDFIWDRSHYLECWNPKEMREDVVVVHGHTPIPYIMDDLRVRDTGDLIEAGPFWYCDNHKVCLDTAAFASGAAFLLDLDTFEYRTFRLFED